MVSRRPRRSAAPDSYRVAFPELTSSGSDDSDGGEEVRPDTPEGSTRAAEITRADTSTADASPANLSGEPSRETKKKKRKEPSPSPDNEADSASGSEFEPEVIKSKDGTVVPVEEEDDEVFAEDLVQESESGDSGVGDKDLDNISIANSEGLEVGSGAKPGKQGVKFGGKTRYFFTSGPNEDDGKSTADDGPPPVRIVGRTLSATAPALVGTRKGELRRKMQAQHKPYTLGTQRKLGLYELQYGPAFWPPPLVLSRSFDEPDQGLEILAPLSEAERLFYLKRSAYLPFGPDPSICFDLGWCKGKWIRNEEGAIQRAKRWGGWYDAVRTDTASFEFVQNIVHIMPHLPRNIFPALPAPIYLDAKVDDQSERVEDNEDDLWDQNMATDAVPVPGDSSNAAEVFRSNAGHLQRYIQQTQPKRDAASENTQHEDESVMKVLMGPMTSPSGQHTPQTTVEIDRFTSIRLDTYLPDKPGFALNAGGPVLGLDWCPQPDDAAPAAREYLAVSTVSELPSLVYRIPRPLPAISSMIQIWSLDTTVPTDFGISTGANKGEGMRFDLALLTDFEGIQLKWCPHGGAKEAEPLEISPVSNGAGTVLERLGLLACLSTQGILSIFDVPKPESARRISSSAADDLVFLKRKVPLLLLELGNVPISCFDWASHERIVAGCSTGHVAVFDIGKALASGVASVEPTAFVPVHSVNITAITAIRQPLQRTDGQWDMFAESPRVATTSLDGSCRMIDLRDTGSLFNFGHERAVRVAMAYQPFADCLQFVDQEMAHRYLGLKGREFGATSRLTSQGSPVLDLASSEFHPFFASAAADGSAGVINTVRRLKRGGHATHYVTRMFRMDFDRRTGTYRMLDNLVPDPRSSTDERLLKRKETKKKKPDQLPEVNSAMPSYSWSPEVAVQRVAWSHSLRRAHMLASGLACGLVRVDMTASHWTEEVSVSTRDAGFKGSTGDESD